MKIIVLYEELAWYFVNCLNVLAKNHACSITVFCKKTNPNAPFEFKYVHPQISIKDRAEYTTEELLTITSSLKPDIIFLGGWIYKPYLSVIKSGICKNSILGLDNQWLGNIKQVFGSLYFRITLKSYIHKVFVPGNLQYLFAKKLGYQDKNISLGAYSCDYEMFHNYFEENKMLKQNLFPKRFLFVGRYVKEKGINDLWDAFKEIQEETPNDWELWCLGTGAIPPIQHQKIKHFGFKQPNELSEITRNSGVLVLPSVFEPWGVVVHEYAAAGFPLICSDKVGAIDAFLREGKNGFVFPAGNKKALKIKLRKFMDMSQEELNLMSEYSAKISSDITPEIWAATFIKFYING